MLEVRTSDVVGDPHRELVSTTRILALVGELCSYSTEVVAPVLHELSATTSDLVLDLSAIEFADASALTLLLDLGRQLAARGGSLELDRASPCMRRLLVIAELDDLLVSASVAVSVADAATSSARGGGRP